MIKTNLVRFLALYSLSTPHAHLPECLNSLFYTICYSKSGISVSLRMGNCFSHSFGSQSNSNSSPFPRVLAKVHILNLGRVLPKSLNSPFSILTCLSIWSNNLRIQSHVQGHTIALRFCPVLPFSSSILLGWNMLSCNSN